MKALTIHQPWASLVVQGIKTVETRSRPTKHRGRLAIHAGQKLDLDAYYSPGVFDALVGVAAAEAFPDRGPCSFCGMAQARHREVEAIVERVGAGDRAADVARDFEISTEVVAGLWEGRPDSLSLGVILGTVEVVDCVPIGPEEGREPNAFVCSHIDGGLTWFEFKDGPWRPATKEHNITDQRPFGDFTPGRWAWLLDDPQPLDEPIPARGRQGLWEWER